MTRRPEATAWSIEDLLEKVQLGEIRVPAFQRSFRWDVKDILQLLDSMYRGYPIGTVLFWKREAPAARLEFGPVRIDAPRAAQGLWVVDGQQRITSIAGVLLHPPLDQTGSSGHFAVCFDLNREMFVHAGSPGRRPAWWLPMNQVLDSEVLQAWLDDYPGREKNPGHFKTAVKLGKMIREYRLPVYIVEADDEKVLRNIFDRVNSSGKPLKKNEIFDALHGGLSGGHPSDLRTLSEDLEALGFGTIDESWLLKAALAVQGLDIHGNFRRLVEEQVDLAGTLQATDRALREAIVFLKRDVGIPHIRLLPYQFPLIPLARFFSLHPEPHPRNRELLARWIWRGAVTEIHRGDSIPAVNRTLKSITPDEDRSVQALLATVPAGAGQAWRQRGFNFRTAESKLQANAVVSLHPRDLRTGQLVDIPRLLEAEGPATFSRVFTGARELEDSPGKTAILENPAAWLSSLANRVLHPPLVGKSIGELLRRGPPVDPAVLQSHAISPEAYEALRGGAVITFLERREQALAGYVKDFLEARARWAESTRPPIQSLVVSDEEE